MGAPMEGCLFMGGGGDVGSARCRAEGLPMLGAHSVPGKHANAQTNAALTDSSLPNDNPLHVLVMAGGSSGAGACFVDVFDALLPLHTCSM
eukprot:2759984-Amphidinium_carterae.2